MQSSRTRACTAAGRLPLLPRAQVAGVRTFQSSSSSVLYSRSACGAPTATRTSSSLLPAGLGALARRGLTTTAAPGYASGAAAPEQHEAVAELTTLNYHDIVLDKGHIKLPVFIYCVPGDERAKHAEVEDKLKHEVQRTAGRSVMRVLDVKAHPDLAEQLRVPTSSKWPVILAYSRGVEARRVAGHVSGEDVTRWVLEEAWLLNE